MLLNIFDGNMLSLPLSETLVSVRSFICNFTQCEFHFALYFLLFINNKC